MFMIFPYISIYICIHTYIGKHHGPTYVPLRLLICQVLYIWPTGIMGMERLFWWMPFTQWCRYGSSYLLRCLSYGFRSKGPIIALWKLNSMDTYFGELYIDTSVVAPQYWESLWFYRLLLPALERVLLSGEVAKATIILRWTCFS